jgi:hypothetical protein
VQRQRQLAHHGHGGFQPRPWSFFFLASNQVHWLLLRAGARRTSSAAAMSRAGDLQLTGTCAAAFLEFKPIALR